MFKFNSIDMQIATAAQGGAKEDGEVFIVTLPSQPASTIIRYRIRADTAETPSRLVTFRMFYYFHFVSMLVTLFEYFIIELLKKLFFVDIYRRVWSPREFDPYAWHAYFHEPRLNTETTTYHLFLTRNVIRKKN